MEENRRYFILPGGVCPSCEHSPLWIYTDTQTPRYYCEECGNSDALPLAESRDHSSRNNNLINNWTRRVKERDGYACVICGDTKDLDVHHLMQVAKAPEIQSRIGNGLTVCRRCHKLIHDTTGAWPEKYR